MVLVWKDSRLAHSLLEHPECLPPLTTRRPSNVSVPVTAPRARWRAALLSLGLSFTSFGCFTDAINRAPVVTSIEADAPPMRGQPASFTATAYDPDSDSFTLSWKKTDTCTDMADRAMWPTPDKFGQRLMLDTGDTGAPFCVWSFATDRYGAVGAKNRPFSPGNLPPIAKIRLVRPEVTSLYQLYTTFVLSSESTDPDQDPLTSSEWKFAVQPPGAMKQLLATGCPSDVTGTDVHCFQADVPGHYEVVLTVTTADGQSSSDVMTFDVNVDTFPCIDIPSCVPMLAGTPTLDPTMDQLFKVLKVIDDGDGSPSSAQFNWFYTVNGVLLSYEHNYSILPIPHDQYHEGDVSKIRVEVYDRNRQAVMDALSRCGEMADMCAGDPQRPTCYQRVTWTVNWL
jgi:hypothetical protein